LCVITSIKVAAPSGSLRPEVLFTFGNSNRISSDRRYVHSPTVSPRSSHLRYDPIRSRVPCRIVVYPDTAAYPRILSSTPYGCRTLREPATGALTPRAFEWSCVHTSFTSTSLWDEPTPRPLFEPHPLTASLGPHRNWTQPNLLACLNPGEEDRVEGFRSQLPIQGEPEHLRTNLFLNPPSGVGWQRTLTQSLNGRTLPFFGQSGRGTLPAEGAPEVRP